MIPDSRGTWNSGSKHGFASINLFSMPFVSHDSASREFNLSFLAWEERDPHVVRTHFNILTSYESVTFECTSRSREKMTSGFEIADVEIVF